MPLSPQDKAYWQERLGWKSFLYLAGITSIMGCIVWPLFLFTLSYSGGHGGEWTWSYAFSMAGANFMLALLVSTIIWCIGQAYLWMEWLPPKP